MNYLQAIKNITTEETLHKYLVGTEEGENCDFNVNLPIKTDNSGTNTPGKIDYFGVCKLLGAFANTSGGILYLGIQEKKGVFSGIIGIDIENWEHFLKHLFEKLRSVFDPIIEGISVRRIQLANGKYVVMIICSESDYLHQLILDGQPAMFPKRIGQNVVAMTAAEIKAAFMRKDKINKIADYRRDRIDKMLAMSSDFVIKEPSVILHAIPDQSDISLKTSEWDFKQRFTYVLDRNGSGLIASNDRLCAEGIRFFTNPTRHLLITKVGGLELVCDIESAVDESIVHFGEWATHSLALISQLLVQLAIEVPTCQSWRFAMTLVGVKGKKLRRGTGMFPFTSPRSLPQNRYELDFVRLEVSTNANDLFLQMEEKYHPALESIWHEANATMSRSTTLQHV